MGQTHRGAEAQTATSYERAEGLGPPAAPCRAHGPHCAPPGSGETGHVPSRAQGGSSIHSGAGGPLRTPSAGSPPPHPHHLRSPPPGAACL